MDAIYFQDEHRDFRDSVRRFFETEVDGEAWEAAGAIPRDIWQRMGALGFLGITLPEAYGGTEADMFYAAVFLEELGRTGFGGFAAAVGVQQFMATAHIHQHGSDALKQRYLAPSIRGEAVGALAVSEPDAGSDVAHIRTRARKVDGGYLVNGAKTFITNGCDGDFATVAVRTGGEGAGGISLLVVDQGLPGFSHRRLKKMGWHCGDTAELAFDNVHVPADRLVGEEGRGFYYIMEAFQLERLVAALTNLGGIEHTLALAHDYLNKRQAFGRDLARFQTLRHTYVDLCTELEAARHLTYHACDLMQRGVSPVDACTMAKLKTSELAKQTADACLQFFGGYGFMEEYPIARIYRDARVGTIVGGTSEIMREILAKTALDGVRYERPHGETTDKAAPDLDALFASLPGRYKGGAPDATLCFTFSGDLGGAFTVRLQADQVEVTPKATDSADCTIACDGALYRAIETGEASPEAAFMSGQIQVSNPALMLQFLGCFAKWTPT